jgi:multimeric flavodoxin WrbA
MRVVVFSSSPNKDGLTAACAGAAAQGCKDEGAEVEEICLNDRNVGSCQACDRGWGTCGKEHHCQVEDDFQELHRKCIEADGLVLVTPVYFRDMSESAKRFTDRLRRCEAKHPESLMAGKPIIAVAGAGGSGTWLVNCLNTMETLIWHLKAKRFDLIPITRWTRSYKIDLVHTAAKAMVRELASRE